jgi:hypothetical protein
MFLDSLFELPSQAFKSIESLGSKLLSIPGQISGDVKDTVQGVANTAGQTLQGVTGQVTSSLSGMISTPLIIVGGAVVMILLVKK